MAHPALLALTPFVLLVTLVGAYVGQRIYRPSYRALISPEADRGNAAERPIPVWRRWYVLGAVVGLVGVVGLFSLGR